MRLSYLVLVLGTFAFAQEKMPASFDPRLSVYTILREDGFAGMLGHDQARFERCASNLEILLRERPQDRANVMVWKGFLDMNRAAFGREKGRDEEYAASGRVDESAKMVDEILRLMPGTPYYARAKKWKDDPTLASRSALGCQTCHEPGRLTAKHVALANR